VGEFLGGIVRQAVDERPDVELRPHRVHGVGGVAADGIDPDVLSQLFGDLVGDMGVAREGVVEPPEHRHPCPAQGTDSPGLDDSVGEDEVGAEGQPPQQGRLDAAAPGDDDSPGFEEERHRAAVLRAEDDHLVAHAAQHRHSADQNDGRAGHVQQVAHDEHPLPLHRPDILGTDVPLVVGQRQRETDVVPAELCRQRQQLGGVPGVTGLGQTAQQQLPGDEGAAGAGRKAGAVVEGSGTCIAEDGVTGDVVCAAAQRIRKAGQGRGHQAQVFFRQQHAAGAAQTPAGKVLRQQELAVELVAQGGFQRGPPPRCVDGEKDVLCIKIFLLGELCPLQGGITAVHPGPPLSCHDGTGSPDGGGAV